MLQGKFNDSVPAFRRAHDPPYRRQPFGCEKSGGNAICGDHEILDNTLGPASFFGYQPFERVAVEHRTRLNCFKIQRAMNVSERFQFLRRAVLEPQVLLEAIDIRNLLRLWPGLLQPRSDAVISKLSMVDNGGQIDV